MIVYFMNAKIFKEFYDVIILLLFRIYVETIQIFSKEKDLYEGLLKGAVVEILNVFHTSVFVFQYTKSSQFI